MVPVCFVFSQTASPATTDELRSFCFPVADCVGRAAECIVTAGAAKNLVRDAAGGKHGVGAKGANPGEYVCATT